MGIEDELKKLWFKSRTILFNIATLVVMTANEMMSVFDVISGDAADMWRTYILVANALANIYLRSITHTAIKFK